MSMIDAKVKEHFDVLVSKLANHLRDDFDKFEYELNSPTGVVFVSGLYFLKIKFWIKDDNKNNDKKEPKTTVMRFVAKTPITFSTVQETLRMNKQFDNEILFYRNFAKNSENYPKCIYIDESEPLRSTLILEDVSMQGYNLNPLKVNISMDDTVAAMKQIARFHAEGYIMKEQQPEKFFQLIENIQETRFDNDGSDMKNYFVNLLNNVTIRSITYLREHNYDRNFCDKLEVFMKNGYRNIIWKNLKPIEPLAVFCHGDFTINNMLFKKNDKEIKIKLIDFALITYASPAIDLSTFLYLSCLNHIDKDHFSIVLRVYHDELTKCLKNGGLTDLDKYSYEAFYNDYVDHAVFGYGISTFFLYMLMEKHDIPVQELLAKTPKEVCEIVVTCGGEEVSKPLADLLLHLKELGCFNHVLS